jgi:ABC-type branched-subunit amino acid transport system substrate-binding protein
MRGLNDKSRTTDNRQPTTYLLAALLCVFGFARAMQAATLTPAEQRGRQIYLRGESPSGRPITAVIGQGETTEIPATALACGSCHGPEGRGVAEGTIVPADIRWSALKTILLRPEGRGRRRLRYDDALLARAIRKGRDPGDEPLSPIMPRFRLDDRDLADLTAYLHRLGDEPQPGLTADTLTIATLIPLSGPRAAAGAMTRDVIAGALADVNAQGGLHGRTLALRAIDSAAPDASRRMTEELTSDRIFAVVCASLDASVESIIHRERIPLVTPLPSDAGSSATAPSSFFLFSDLESQALALAAHIGAGARNVYIVRADTPAARAAATALEERAESLQWTIHEKPAGAKRDNDLLILLAVDPTATLRQLDVMDWHPQILLAGAALTTLPASASSILIATPTVPTDLTPEAQHDLAAFAERHHLPAGNVATQTATYSAIKIFLEALKRTGHDLTREKLITTLETLYQYPTGLTPPVTWSRNHHTGTTGAYILTIDPIKRSVVPAGWIAPTR